MYYLSLIRITVEDVQEVLYHPAVKWKCFFLRRNDEAMGLYKRVFCPRCDKYLELRNGEDKLKKVACPRCGHSYAVTADNAVYYIDYSYNNKRYREKVGPNKSLAESALAKRQTEITEKRFFNIRREEKVLFEEFSKDYLETYSKQHKKSWITDEYHIKCFNAFFGGKFLFEITVQDVEHFKMERQKEVSKSSVNRQMGVLRGMFNKAVAWGKLESSPMKCVQFFAEPPGRLRFLEKEEINILINNCDTYLRPVVIVAVLTGMRRGEIFNLKWQDVDFKRNNITLLETKNGKARQLPMNFQVRAVLSEMYTKSRSEHVFCYDNGERIQDVRKSFSTALRKSGINSFHFHDLRHTFASQLVMAGVDLNTVRELMGHKDITMTLRYAHLAPSHKQHAVDALGKAIDTRMAQERTAEVPEILSAVEVVENQLLATNGT